jgi:hypothetical protein
MRCGECERKLVVAYLKGMADNLLKEGAPGREEDRKVMARTLRLATTAIENGVHERGVAALPLCTACGEDEE